MTRRFGVLCGSFLLVLGLAACSHDVKNDDLTANAKDSAAMASNGAGVAADGTSDLGLVYFAYDSFHLSKEARTALKHDAEWMKAHGTASVQLEGHCDERGTTEYNLALGEKRARAVQTYLERLGIEPSRLSTISYGSERPVDPGHDEAAWAKNRRVVPVSLPSHLSKAD
jgi:peptidoglycan-associated lipoprotein